MPVWSLMSFCGYTGAGQLQQQFSLLFLVGRFTDTLERYFPPQKQKSMLGT